MSNSKRALTLTEVLVVLVMIAIFSSLIITSSMHPPPAPRKQISITIELQQLAGAIEGFKNDFGVYPPNFMTNSVHSPPGHASIPSSEQVLRIFKKAFPRSEEQATAIHALAGISVETGDTKVLAEGMTASEALVFWIGGFSQDPRYPLSGVGGPSFCDADGDADGILDAKDENLDSRNMRFEFDPGRLGPRTKDGVFDDSGPAKDGGRYIEYDDPRDGTRRRINFWQYYPWRSSTAIVYFDVSRYSPLEYYPANNPLSAANVGPLMQLPIDKSLEYPSRNDLRFVDQGKFQILHAGLDDEWGDFSDIRSGAIYAPKGPFVGAVADTLANFMLGTLEEKQE